MKDCKKTIKFRIFDYIQRDGVTFFESILNKNEIKTGSNGAQCRSTMNTLPTCTYDLYLVGKYIIKSVI